jgi:hypothetical protein
MKNAAQAVSQAFLSFPPARLVNVAGGDLGGAPETLAVTPSDNIALAPNHSSLADLNSLRKLTCLFEAVDVRARVGCVFLHLG